MKNNIIIDTHCHIFNYDCVPPVFQNRYTKSLNPIFLKGFLKIFNNWFNKDDILDRARDLINIGMSEKISDVANILHKQSRHSNYPLIDDKVIFTPLTMDMEYGLTKEEREEWQAGIKSGKYKSFDEQINETSAIVLDNPGVFFPFIAADPRRIKKNRNNSDDIDGIHYLIDALENKGFWGVKIYPPLGYSPTGYSSAVIDNFDKEEELLMPLYKYCADNDIPVTTHTAFAGTYSNQNTPTKDKKKKYWGAMAEPKNWRKVLEKSKNLKLNFGHFGGDLLGKDVSFAFENKDQLQIENGWREEIIGIMLDSQYPNIYADISFHPNIFINPEEYFEKLSEHIKKDGIGKKILFGTDWWMSRFILRERQYIDKFIKLAREYDISGNILTDIMYNNSIEFLGLNNIESNPFKSYKNFIEKNGQKLPKWIKNGLKTID